LVGLSGSGKSTLIDTLIGFHVPNSGKVLIDDKNLQDLSQSEWRKTIGYVPQNPIFFGYNTSLPTSP